MSTMMRIQKLAGLLHDGDLSVADELTCLLVRVGACVVVNQRAPTLQMLLDHAPWSYEHDGSGVVHVAWAEPEPPRMFGANDFLSVQVMLLCGTFMDPTRLKKRQRVVAVQDRLCRRCAGCLMKRVRDTMEKTP